MRVNIYAEETTDRVELVKKHTSDGEFTGVRFYLELPIRVPVAGGHAIEHRGPFIHAPGDDDSAAVTFWGKRGLYELLEKGLILLHQAGFAPPKNPNAGKAFYGDGGSAVTKHTGNQRRVSGPVSVMECVHGRSLASHCDPCLERT